MTEPVAELMEQVWSSIDELCSMLDPEDWSRPTDCPGWTVKDLISHISGTESRWLGRPQPAPLAERPAHVQNDLGALNEAAVDIRRPWPPERVLAEFREVTDERLKALRGLDEAGWEEEVDTPLGRGKVRDHIVTRVLDCFYHEQDVRRATGKAGHLHGDVARLVFEQIRGTMPYVVAKRAAAPDGTRVAFDVATPPAAPFAVAVSGRWGSLADPDEATQAEPGGSTGHITCDLETFLCLAGGRWTAERALADGRARIDGDEALARRVLDNMAVTP